MKVAIVAEGRGDLAVIRNILKGKLDIDGSDIQNLLPEYEYDQTDLAQMPVEAFSNWTLVKSKCQNRDDLKVFLNLNKDAFLVIQIDTAERVLDGYDVHLPQRTGNQNQDDYCIALRNNIIDKINEWLENNLSGKIAYAVCIEETEAWIMTLYNETNTSKYADPKRKLQEIFDKKLSLREHLILSDKDTFKKMKKLSDGFSKKKVLKQVQKNNKSLDLFCESLDVFKSIDAN
ncbi:MAG: hypothetical protein LBO74_06150 [Candidatus Symbiothrix sp.]|jgi:hypothetical protein|nr:hypothetical protein [Candidatus Symbiothrix sp.]